MKKANCLIDPIKIGLGMASFAILTGCAGHGIRAYVSYDRYNGYNRYGYYGAYDDEGAAPDHYLFGGGYERGSDVNAYSSRGFGSLGSK